MRLASRPRPTRLPAHSGSDWTDGNAHARLRHNPSRAGTSASLVPVQCPRGRVRRPRWTPRSDRFRTAHARPCPAGHRPLHRARQPNRKRCGQGNGRTARKAFGHPRSPRPQGGPPGHAEPLLWGRRLRLGNQGRLRDGNTASATVTTAVTRQLLGVAPRSKPRLGALLSSERISGRA